MNREKVILYKVAFSLFFSAEIQLVLDKCFLMLYLF